jgi:hypothetical protein
MSTPLKALILCAILAIAASAFAQINIVNYDFGAVTISCSYGFVYQGPIPECLYPSGGSTQDLDQSPGFGWILGGMVPYMFGSPNGGSGLTGPNTEFFPPPFNGLPFNQAVFLQDTGSFVWQQVDGFTAGTYTLSFYLGSRYHGCCDDGNQTVIALIDGNVIGKWAMSSFTPFTLRSVNFTVGNGSHTLEFMGTRPGDHTAFLSYVVITPTNK